jgi:hypothetical protein
VNKFSKSVKGVFFSLFGRYLSWFFSSPRLLDMRRCNRKDVLRAVKTARANHPDMKIYVLCDFSLGAIFDTERIATLEALRLLPVPSVVVLACNSDELAFDAVQAILKRGGMFYYGADRPFPAARYFHRDEAARIALKESHGANLAKFDLPDFENIAQVIHATRLLAGDYVEIGVYKGSSAYLALSYMGHANIQRRSYFFDTFSGFDYEGTASSVDRSWFNTHTDTSQEAVQKLLAHFAVPHEVIKSNIITDVLPEAIKQIAVCNIDVDMYDAVAAALIKVAPLVVEGGIIIAEDQGHTPLLIGAYVAVREFLESPQGKYFVPIEMLSGQMFLVKTRAGY